MESEIIQPAEEWQVIYQDNFDWDNQRIVEKTGCGLVEGLIELWARHLFETVLSDGKVGFSVFNLWRTEAKRSVEISGDWEGQVHLRGWIFKPGCEIDYANLQEETRKRLRLLAEAHLMQIRLGHSSEPILLLAKTCQNWAEFTAQIMNL